MDSQLKKRRPMDLQPKKLDSNQNPIHLKINDELVSRWKTRNKYMRIYEGPYSVIDLIDKKK